MSGVNPNWFKRAQRGLYAGKTRISGNHVSPSKRHVRRHWLPNAQRKALWSDVLGRSISMKVTAAALRTIDRVGGLDEYILNTTPQKLASEKGESLRRQMMKKMVREAKLARRLAAQTEKPAPAAEAPMQ